MLKFLRIEGLLAPNRGINTTPLVMNSSGCARLTGCQWDRAGRSTRVAGGDMASAGVERVGARSRLVSSNRPW